ncbi:unnamed protein product [Phytomonas sp. Hart1]|nr:unnamed protein product [Phytomonas sp. Hart1]|eukprot:CCW68609.1 unnamed protein product [Phytomonas sp. isolate Hart1]
MTDLERLIKLLSQTDGRDKIYKFLAGFFRILADVSDAQDPNVKAYKAIGNSIGGARSLMRMGKFVGDVPKLEQLIHGFHAKGLHGTELKRLVEFLRVLANSLYILGDNVAFVAKHRLVPLNAAAVTTQAKFAQFWGFFLAAVLDLLALRAALKKRLTDLALCKKEAKGAIINLTRDASDVLVTMASVGYLREVWRPSNVTLGALTCVSGSVATYLNWNKIA